MTIAALFVAKPGIYFDLPGVDAWDLDRDAREYEGPHRVIAHPPCQRWGRYWGGSPLTWPRLKLGDDGGCFASALRSVRKWGGVLEHPEASQAWRIFGLKTPKRHGGWRKADEFGGYTCCVEQAWYGHRARKLTWLYAVGTRLPQLKWGRAPGEFSTENKRWGAVSLMPRKERNATPPEFARLLLGIATSVR